MPRGTAWASEQEIEDLREEIRVLREQQALQKKEDADKPSQESKQSDKDEASKQQEGKQQESKQKDSGGEESKADDKSGGTTKSGDADDSEKDDEDKPKKPHPVRNALIVVGAALILIGGIVWWLHARQFETTDDAMVAAHVSAVGARVAGTITAVYFEENQFVDAGQTLADLDPRDYTVAVAQARSQLLQAQGQVQAERPNVPVTQVSSQVDIATSQSAIASANADLAGAQRDYEAAQAKIAEAEANNTKAQADVERFRPLAAKDEVPQQQFDQVIATAKAQAANVTAAQASAQSALQQVAKARAEIDQTQQRADQARKNAPQQVAAQQGNLAARQAMVQAAKAQLDQALLNLSYAKIFSPVRGIVVKRNAELGQHVSAGQQVALITQTDDLWVNANYKETQLQLMKNGQSVVIHIDALDADFDGYVESMPAASGAISSLLPPENATGNFVKVVQRLPVRIRFKQGQQGLDRLRTGMSAEPTTRVR